MSQPTHGTFPPPRVVSEKYHDEIVADALKQIRALEAKLDDAIEQIEACLIKIRGGRCG